MTLNRNFWYKFYLFEFSMYSFFRWIYSFISEFFSQLFKNLKIIFLKILEDNIRRIHIHSGPSSASASPFLIFVPFYDFKWLKCLYTVEGENPLFFLISSFSDTPALKYAKIILRIFFSVILLWYDGDWLHSSISSTSLFPSW